VRIADARTFVVANPPPYMEMMMQVHATKSATLPTYWTAVLGWLGEVGLRVAAEAEAGGYHVVGARHRMPPGRCLLPGYP